MAVLDANEIMFTAFEPKVPNRFIMYIDGIPSYLIKKASAPGFEANMIKLDHINVYRKVKGKVEWNDMTWGSDFKQIGLIPTIFVTKSYGTRYNLCINFLCFDFGLWVIIKK